MQQESKSAGDGGQKLTIVGRVTGVFARLHRTGAAQATIATGAAIDEDLDDMEPEEESALIDLRDLIVRRPVMSTVVVLIILTIGAVWVYPMTVVPPKPLFALSGTPTPWPTFESVIPTATRVVLPGASTAGPSAIASNVGTPIAGMPAVPTPTRGPGISLGNLPTPPPPPTPAGGNNNAYVSGAPRADTPPIAGRTAAASAAAPTHTPAPTATARPTPIPTATRTPTVTPTPGPTTVKVSVPSLQSESGYYYVIQALAGTIDGTWQIGGGGTGQLFVLQGQPYGSGSGVLSSPPSNPQAVAVGNVSSNKSSIAPVDVSAGSYTLLFNYSGVNGVGATSASITYVPQSPPAATVAATATPTHQNTPSPTPTVSGSGTTPTATPATTSTPTSTPAPAQGMPTPYPAP